MTKVNGNTKTAAKMALDRGAISQESHDAVMAGELGLSDAKDLGRGAGPSGPVPRADKNDRTPTKTPCLCGCDEMVPRTFKPGHDSRMFRVAREHLTEGREISKEQREYLEASGKMRRMKDKLAAETAKKAERDDEK